MTSQARESRADSLKDTHLKVFHPDNQAVAEIDNTKNAAKQKETTAQLHLVDEKGERTPITPIHTIGESQKIVNEEAGGLLLGGLRKISSLGAAIVAAFATVAGLVFPEKHIIRKWLDTLSSGFARGAIGLGNATSAVDAGKDHKIPMAMAQGGSLLTALFAPRKDMTTDRGFFIGAYNTLPALETVHGKVHYDGLQDYLVTNWNALKTIFKQFLKNPMGLFDPNQKGPLGALTGIAMSVSTLLYMLTGFKIFATGRNALGMVVELEKVKPQHLKEGRAQYAASGYLMMAGSAANLLSQYAGKYSSSLINLNFLLNALGNERSAAALQANEPAKIGSPISFMGMITKNLQSMFSFGREAAQVLEKAQPVILKKENQSAVVQQTVQKQVQAMNGNGASNGASERLRAFTVPKASVRVIENKAATKSDSVAAPQAHVPVPDRLHADIQHTATNVMGSKTTNAPVVEVKPRGSEPIKSRGEYDSNARGSVPIHKDRGSEPNGRGSAAPLSTPSKINQASNTLVLNLK